MHDDPAHDRAAAAVAGVMEVQRVASEHRRLGIARVRTLLMWRISTLAIHCGALACTKTCARPRGVPSMTMLRESTNTSAVQRPPTCGWSYRSGDASVTVRPSTDAIRASSNADQNATSVGGPLGAITMASPVSQPTGSASI